MKQNSFWMLTISNQFFEKHAVLLSLRNKICSIKNVLCLCFILFSVPYSFSQDLIQKLEAENGELTSPAKVKSVVGYSGNKYVGDNDSGSAIVFKNVNIAEEGTYEFKTYYTSMHIRSVAIQSGCFPAVICTCPTGTEDWNRPPVGEMTTYIYLEKGNNTIKIAPHNGGGPNIDKFEIWSTGVSMPRPEITRNTFSYDLTDDAIITVGGTNETLSNLNDNDELSVYQFSGNSVQVYIECDMPYLITGYLLSAGAASSQDVKNWKLEYSTNGSTYSTLSYSRNEDLNTAVFFEIDRQPHTDSGKAAKYYRLTAQGGEIGEIQLFGLPYLANSNNKNFPEDIAEGVDLHSKVIANPLGVFSGSFDERCFNLFDRNMSKKYYWGSDPVFDVEIELNNSYSLNYYTLTSCQDYPERDPKSWVVEGFDRDWETVSEVSGFTFPTRYATMKFPADSDKPYKGFRLRTTENNGADSFQLLKWQLFGEQNSTSLGNLQYGEIEIFSSENEIIIQNGQRACCYISDLSGRLMKSVQLNPGVSTIKMPAGIYIVKFILAENSLTTKIIVR